MTLSDYDSVDTEHWSSRAQVEEFIDRSGIALMLAFDDQQFVGQLYLQEYDPNFIEPSTGERFWADFQAAEPLGLDGRYLSLGCYHVGWTAQSSWASYPPVPWQASLLSRGIGTTLLRAVIDWFNTQSEVDGLISWALAPGSKPLLQWAGQMSFHVYHRYGFQEIKKTRDPRWDDYMRRVLSDLQVDLELPEERADAALLRVICLRGSPEMKS